ncbi:MAG: Fur family transcriptional regulator [Actinomycetota bacterium]
MSTDELHSAVATRLAGIEQRYTSKRRALVDVLARSGRPLTIPDILEVAGALPQSSIYRNLAVLEEATAVRRIASAGDFALYELSEDITEHHHHLVCSACGRVVDVTLPERVEKAIEVAEGDVAADTGFLIEHHSLDLVGLCPECRS